MGQFEVVFACYPTKVSTTLLVFLEFKIIDALLFPQSRKNGTAFSIFAHRYFVRRSRIPSIADSSEVGAGLSKHAYEGVVNL